MKIIGLTGSIGMGKSTLANMMRALGIPVHDSDEEVHRLLSQDKNVQQELRIIFPPNAYPEIYKKSGEIDRKAIGKIVFKDAQKKHNLESLLHPKVHQAQNQFIRFNRTINSPLICLDIPLLFETNADTRVDFTITVSTPYHIQRSRVLSRPHMSEEKFHAILEKQIPDGEKRARADYVVETGLGRAFAMRSLQKIVAQELQHNESMLQQNRSNLNQEKYYLYGS